MRPAPELPSGRRLGLVIATSIYDDPGLGALRSPGRDAADFAEVLADPSIGGFDVTSVIDAGGRDVSLALEGFLKGRDPSDFVLLYMSCHGLLDEVNRLYFAARDTIKDKLNATAIDAQLVKRMLTECRARRQLVVLDCCFSGAFLRDSKGAQDGRARPVEASRLQSDNLLVEGRGRVILTASRAIEYSFEGEPIEGGTDAGSVFTSALVQGLRTGDADMDNDGLVSPDEAYKYAYQQLRAVEARQNPQFSAQGEGVFVLARSPAGIRELPASAGFTPDPQTSRLAAELGSPLRLPSGTALRGAAADLANLRQISRALDDPETLGASARDRSIEDVVALVAAVRVNGRDTQAEDLLRVAATARPADEVIQLIAAVRAAGHASDADSLLASAGGGRTPAEVTALATAIAQTGEEGDIAILLEWAGRTRAPDDIVRLVAELREAGRSAHAADVLGVVARMRPEEQVAETMRLARRSGTGDDVEVMLSAFRQRPAAHAAGLVAALRAAGDDDSANAVLGWVEELEPAQLAALVAALRATTGGGEDADNVLRWAGWKSAPRRAAALLAILAVEYRNEDLSAVVGATESRPIRELADLVIEIELTLHGTTANHVLALAARRPARDVVELLELFRPDNADHYLIRDAKRRYSTDFCHHVTTRPVADVLRVVQAAPHDIKTQLLSTAGQAPAPQVEELITALREVGRDDEIETIIKGTIYSRADRVAELVVALAPDGTLPESLVNAVRLRREGEFAAVMRHLVELRHEDLARQVIQSVPRRPGVFHSKLAAAHAAVPVDSAIGRELTEERAREDRRWVFQRLMVGLTAVAFTIVAFGLGAGLSRLASQPRLDGDDWLAMVPTVVVGVVLFLIAAFALVRGVLRFDAYDADSPLKFIGVIAAVGLVAGFVLGFALGTVAEIGMTVRAWLAWNF